MDPIDGSANFAHGRGDHAVSVGAEIDGGAAVGAVLLPASGRWVVTTSWGVRAGTDVGPEPDAGRALMNLTRPTETAQALVTFGLPYLLAQRREVFALSGHLVHHLQAVRVIGSAACDFHALISGESDASITVGLFFVTPVVTVAAAAVLLDEAVTVATLLGLVLIIAGSRLATRGTPGRATRPRRTG